MSIGSRERAFKLPSSSKLVIIRHFGAIDVFMLFGFGFVMLLASTVFDSLSFVVVVVVDDTAAVANFRVILTVTLSVFYIIEISILSPFLVQAICVYFTDLNEIVYMFINITF